MPGMRHFSVKACLRAFMENTSGEKLWFFVFKVHASLES